MVKRVVLPVVVLAVLTAAAAPALAHTRRVNDHVRVTGSSRHIGEVARAVRELDYPWELLDDDLRERSADGRTRGGPMITVVVHDRCCRKQPNRYEDMETAAYVAPHHARSLTYAVQHELGHTIDHVLERHREVLLDAHERDSWYPYEHPWHRRPVEQFANQAVLEWGSARPRPMSTWDSELFVRSTTTEPEDDEDDGGRSHLARTHGPFRVGVRDPRG